MGREIKSKSTKTYSWITNIFGVSDCSFGFRWNQNCKKPLQILINIQFARITLECKGHHISSLGYLWLIHRLYGRLFSRLAHRRCGFFSTRSRYCGVLKPDWSATRAWTINSARDWQVALRDGPLEKWWGGGGVGKKTKKIHARQNVRKKNSCKEKPKEKKIMHKMGLILTLNQNCNSKCTKWH